MSNLSLMGLGSSTTGSGGGSATSAYGIGNLVFWLKADELVGYGDGDPVDTFPDDSVNGHDFTAPGAANRPTYNPIGISAMPSLRFITNDVMSCVDTSILDGDGAFTVFVVTFPQVNTGDIITKINGSFRGWRGGEVAGRYFELFTSIGNAIQLDQAALAGEAIVGYSKPAGVGSTTIKALKNGVITTGATSTEGTVTTFSNAQSVCIGGFPNPTDSPYNGYISEVVAYSGQLSDVDMLVVNDALNAKWSIYEA